MNADRYTVSVVGIGLMGGSLAYALRGFRDCEIVGYDPDGQVLRRALTVRAIDTAAASPEAAARADLIIYCSSPHTILENIRRGIPHMRRGTIVTEICGVKREMAARITEELPPGIRYIGIHPMAGKEVGGFSNADPELFRGTGMIFVPPEHYDEDALNLLRGMAAHIGSAYTAVNTADEHDAIIAYTSDLMHIAATALCARLPAAMTPAHTAGAFRDCTRIANIDADLWTELLMQNAIPLLPALDRYIESLSVVRDAVAAGDTSSLHDFLQHAADNKRAAAMANRFDRKGSDMVE